MNSLDRLIRLVRRTGDRLIVHDNEAGRDVVIMDLDAYEALITDQRMGELEEGDDALDPWDAGKLETDTQLSDADWHHAAAVLRERQKEARGESSFSVPSTTASVAAWPGTNQPQGTPSTVPAFDDWYGDADLDEALDDEMIDAGHSPSSPFHHHILPQKQPLPFDEWSEEKLSDEEPVFYEEPV